jgi:hypothetical protein
MVSISLPGITRWGNPYSPLSGALGLSPCYGGGLRALFLFGRGVVGMADHPRPRAWTSPFFPCPSMCDIPVQPRFLSRTVFPSSSATCFR